MKPVYQTFFGKEGNCMQACIASLLEMSLDEVPRFPITGQFLAMARFLNQFDIQPIGLPYERGIIPFDCHYIVWGKSERGLYHAVIYLGNNMVHDPHPDNTGLVTLEGIDLFVRQFQRV